MAISISSAVLNAVRTALNDTGTTKYWDDCELIRYYNLFVSAVLSEYPNALTKTIKFQPVAGVEQRLPCDGVTFIRCPANDDCTGGNGIFEVSAEAMMDADPDWYSLPKSPVVQSVIPDPKDPLRFRLYPPNDGNGVVLLDYSYKPADATAVTDEFVLSAAYRMGAFHCILGCAWLKNTPRGDRTKSAFHFSQFDQKVALRVQGELGAKPIPAQQLATTE